jgi:hypothetical protein
MGPAGSSATGATPRHGAAERRLANLLGGLGRAGVVLVAAGPGCFLFCGGGTHLETETGFLPTEMWFTAEAPGGPFTGAWMYERQAWLVGPGGVTRSDDAGATWTKLRAVPTELTAVDGIPTYGEWMVGADGLAGVLHVDTFSVGETGTTAALADVSMRLGWQGVAVGESGTVLTTSDGATWTATTVASVDLNAVDVPYVGDAWIVGDAGTLLRGTAGTWTPVELGTEVDLVAVATDGVRTVVAAADGSVWWHEATGDGTGTDDTGTDDTGTDDTGTDDTGTDAPWTSLPSPGDVRAVAIDLDAVVRVAGGAGIVWRLDGDAWVEEARTADGSGLATLATTGSGTTEGIVAAGASADVLVFGTVDVGFSKSVERADCGPYY